jgi:hypothetical protein
VACRWRWRGRRIVGLLLGNLLGLQGSHSDAMLLTEVGLLAREAVIDLLLVGCLGALEHLLPLGH